MKYQSNEIYLNHLKVDSLYFCGDVHGQFNTFANAIATKGIKNAIVVLCGDVGFGFYKPAYYTQMMFNLHERLVENNVHVIALRGNHDDPHYFTTHLSTIAPELHNEFPNFIFVEDYDVVFTKFGNILCIGGGLSIDRTNRTLNKDYWENEGVKPLSKTIYDRLYKYNIHIVAAHTAPIQVGPYGLGSVVEGWAKHDKYVKVDAIDERTLVDKICNQLVDQWVISDWYYGHFHDSFFTHSNGAYFHGLDCMEFKEHKIE